jgi:hypothetical protein
MIKTAGFISFLRTIPNTVSSHGADSTENTECMRKSAHILNIFVEKINRARRVQFSSHETATQKVLLLPFSILLHFDLCSLCCSHNVHLMFKWTWKHCHAFEAWFLPLGVHKGLGIPYTSHLFADLKKLIIYSVERIMPQMWGNDFRAFECQMDIVWATKEAQFE